jgi:hypothetical protein
MFRNADREDDPSVQVSIPLYIAFIELENAFKNVEWNKMLSTTIMFGMDYNEGWIRHRFFKDQVASTKEEI